LITNKVNDVYIFQYIIFYFICRIGIGRKGKVLVQK